VGDHRKASRRSHLQPIDVQQHGAKGGENQRKYAVTSELG
jgi:hypothetical protein